MSKPSVEQGQNEIVSQVVKLVILGDGAVGKTTLIEALRNYITSFGKNSQASDKTLRTRFIDFHVVPSTSESSVIYSIWDLQGQRQTACHPIDLISDSILGGAGLVIYLFAINDAQSFENLFGKDGWYEITRQRIEREQIPIILVGNKVDTKPEVILEAARKIAKRYPTCKGFLTTSAISGEGIPELVSELQKHVTSLYNYQIVDHEKILHEVVKTQN
jgi:small GTP-binding protein